MSASASNLTQMRPTIRRPASSPSVREEEWIPLTTDSLHDLASPVNQIGSLTDLVVKKYSAVLDEDAKVLAGYLQSSAGRLQNLLNGMRTYMQVVGTPASCRRSDCGKMLSGALAMLQHSIAQSGALVTHDALPELYCDPAQITYTLACLIENSIKFRGDRRPEIHLSAVPERKSWIILVRDNGIGIDPRYATRIFAPFKRIHNDAYPGSGIGLAITKRVIERHGGRIWVESQIAEGATFFVELPKMHSRRATPSREKRAVA
ncbi:MAG: ATP-binding protein [Bryobacteraceae bacterium]|jgi:light-regulated signal transduction histidine kinase (bacteriophytochrome)